MTNVNKNKLKSGVWNGVFLGLWHSPLGILGLILTIACGSLLIIGIIAELLGAFPNPYTGMIIFMALPVGLVLGLILMPLAAYLRRKKWEKNGWSDEPLQINLSSKKHRLFIIGFIIITSINFAILVIAGYKDYKYTESNQFCGTICHTVMSPEFTAHQNSPHARVNCVTCHIGSGTDYFIRAKFSAFKQVMGIVTGHYNKPIHAPVESLRPSEDTCEQCHWSEKYSGNIKKTFVEYSNENQLEPQTTNLTLYVGGLNPKTNIFESIHSHVSKANIISFLSVDDKRTQIARVKVQHEDNNIEEYVRDDIFVPSEKTNNWRTMDCVDCHNRATHVYKSDEDVVDFGLMTKKINPNLVGIREDSLKSLNKKYVSRDDAKNNMNQNLYSLQYKRNPDLAKTNEREINLVSQYLLEQYLANIWPNMNIGWGTYKSHIGHRYETEGYGCFRCHDDEHITKGGKTLSQDCDICHNVP